MAPNAALAALNSLSTAIAMTPTVERYAHPSLMVSDRLSGPNVATNLTGKSLYLRLRSVQILDDFDGLFDSQMEVHLLGIVIDSNKSEPIQFSTPSYFPGIKPKQRLPFGDGGLGVYYSQTPELPDYLSFHLMIIEDDSQIRDLGKLISDLRKTPEYKTILDAAVALANAANPLYGTAVKVGDALAGLVARAMEQNKDDLIAYFASTYTKEFDNLGVGGHTFYHRDRATVAYEILTRP